VEVYIPKKMNGETQAPVAYLLRFLESDPSELNQQEADVRLIHSEACHQDDKYVDFESPKT
jgi:hypothetical protein